jgi:hypothetical protein
MQMQRFKEVRDGLEAAIHEMQRTGQLLKKIGEGADDEVCFRLHEISSSLEEVVASSLEKYAGDSAPLELYWDEPEPPEDCDLAEWAAKNDVDWDELTDRWV